MIWKKTFYVLCQHPNGRVTGLYILRAVRHFDSAVLGAGVRDRTKIFWGKDVMHSSLSVGAITPAARNIIKRLSPERKFNNTEILREIVYQEGNKENCLESGRERERDRERETERERERERERRRVT